MGQGSILKCKVFCLQILKSTIKSCIFPPSHTPPLAGKVVGVVARCKNLTFTLENISQMSHTTGPLEMPLS